MDTANKQYKFINSRTGYSIYYHTVSSALGLTEIKNQLEKIKAQVATKYGINLATVYWEEVKQVSNS